MPLAHFSAVDSHHELWEPILKNLYEVTIILPQVLQTIHPNATRLLMENCKSAKFPTYPTIESQTQRFKFSTRVFLTSPQQTHTEELALGFNLNQNESYQIFCFKILKDWFDLGWNNETGTLHYKKTLCGDIIIHGHDKEGKVIRRVTYHNAQLKQIAGFDEVNWESVSEFHDFTCTFVADYWEDFYY